MYLPSRCVRWRRNGPENDADAMQEIAAQQGYQKTTVIFDTRATSQVVINEIRIAADTLQSGDSFLLTYSGHGSQTWDNSGDEPSNEPTSKALYGTGGKDETLCLYDRQFKDDELNYWLGQFKPGVRIVVISDCCHAGSNIKNLEETAVDPLPAKGISLDETQVIIAKNQSVYDKTWRSNDFLLPNSRPNASIILLAACQDTEQANATHDPGGYSVFTEKLLAVWDNGNFDGNYRQFLEAIGAQIPAHFYQTPNYLTGGQANPDFENQKPFTI